MGMSSSQARLLTLTARLHSIEWKAQKLEAEKLRLANDSSRVYDEYLDRLEATKIQYSLLGADGAMTYKDATLNAMENGVTDWKGETSKNILFLQNQEGKMLVTPTVAAKYGLVGGTETRDLDTFVHDTTGKNKSQKPVYRQEPVYRKDEIMQDVEVEDTTKIVDFTKIQNNVTSLPTSNSNHNLNPVANITGGVDYSALKTYAEFNPTHSASTAGATQITSATTALTAGGTYTVSDAEGLMKLMQLADATNTAGTTIILTNDIDLSGKSWTGINDFAGTFDGNGYKISNLTGSQGLFGNTSNATVKNVGLEDVNINGNSACVGGLIGTANTTNISNCYTTGTVKNSYSGSISAFASTTNFSQGTGGLIGNILTPGGKTSIINNVYSSADVNASNSDGVGGLIGTSTVKHPGGQFDITNAYAIGNVTGKNGVGGFIGASYNDEDNPSDKTDIRNCYAGGNITGGNQVGGFFGAYLYWGDNDDYCEIEHCNSTGKVNATGSEKGAFAGHLYVKMRSITTTDLDKYLIKFIDCGYASDTGASNAYGIITDEDNKTSTEVNGTTYIIEDLVQSSGSASGLVAFKMAGSIPSIETDGSGDYMQNIIAALVEAGEYDPCDPNLSTADKNAMETKIKNFLKSFSDNDTDNAKLWYLNEAINDYVAGTGDAGFGAALAQDINNGTKTATATYQTGMLLEGKVGRAAASGSIIVDGTHNNQKGEVTIPSKNNIATCAYYALKARDNSTSITEADVQTWINNNYSNSPEDKMYLANLNNDIQNGQNLNVILNAIENNQKYTTGGLYPVDEYNITLAPGQIVLPTYGTTTVSQGTGKYQDVLDHYNDVLDHYDYYWDTTDPDIANAMAMYAMAKRGVEVVTEQQASSYNWLVNIVNVGEAVFSTFNPEQVAVLASLTPAEINNMSDAEYEDLMGIKNTSVSVETFIIEVPDETGLKKAEAKYEADMKKIDRKDRQYDTELAKFETERNAIKEEIDTLKTVAKENVDRTFKLFS